MDFFSHTPKMPNGLAVLNFEARQGEALHRQITRHIRSLIRAGSLASGFKLPRMHDLASHWQTNYFTVHTALTELVREGLLERKPRLGTFVRKQNKELRCVGIYCGGEILLRHELAFFRALHSQLLALLQKEKITNRVFIDYRTPGDQQEPLLELTEAIHTGAIQGLIVPLNNAHIRNWIGHLPIPTSLFNAARTESSRIRIDYDGIMMAACKALRERGCRTVGLISPTPQYEAVGDAEQSGGILAAFRARIKTFELKTKPSWIRTPKKPQAIPQETFGYDEFHKLWALPEKPDGLIVYPDMTVRGVVLALLALQVKVPAELKLVLHRNQNVEILCPLPADWTITQERDVAKALLQQVKDRFSGIMPRAYDIHNTFAKGPAATGPGNSARGISSG